jgi:hypothetical protein
VCRPERLGFAEPRVGSYVMTQFSWVRCQDLRFLGLRFLNIIVCIINIIIFIIIKSIDIKNIIICLINIFFIINIKNTIICIVNIIIFKIINIILIKFEKNIINIEKNRFHLKGKIKNYYYY